MSGGLDILAMKEDDVTKMLAAGVHLGDSNVNHQMERYVYKVKTDGKRSETGIIKYPNFLYSFNLGTPIFNLKKTWEKLMLAARVIASIENPADICAISSGTIGQVMTPLTFNVLIDISHALFSAPFSSLPVILVL